MNEPTQNLIAVLSNVKKLKPFHERTVEDSDEVILYFQSKSGFKFNYVITLDDYLQIDWATVRKGVGYDVADNLYLI